MWRNWMIAAVLAPAVPLLVPAVPLLGDDIDGVQPAALDQPRVNVVIRRTVAGEPLMGKVDGEDAFNVEVFLDTGASSIDLSSHTAELLGVNRETTGRSEARFQDVGVGGGSEFAISEPIYFSIAPMDPNVDVEQKDAIAMTYGVTTGPFRTEVGPLGMMDSLMQLVTGDLDIVGMPAIEGKIVVMDPRDVNSMTDKIRTYVYDAKTAAANGAMIPKTSEHIPLTFVSFAPFTKTSPAGAIGPAIAANPMIGPDPFVAGDRRAPVVALHRAKRAEGTWLLDTGAAASMISLARAAELGVTYAPGTEGTGNPRLVGPGTEKQFVMTIGGIGGSKKSAGFFMDRLSLPTIEGPPVVFDHAPVLVADISMKDAGGKTYTLDGVLGMNFWVGSAMVDESSLLPDIDHLTPGAFKWIVLNQPAGWLGLERDSR